MKYYNKNLQQPVSTYVIWSFLILGLSLMIKRLILPGSPLFYSFGSSSKFQVPKSTKLSDSDHAGSQIQVFYLTIDSIESAENLAKNMLEENLAAYVNIFPQTNSFYKNKGKIESASESVMLIHSTAEKSGQLNNWLKKNHPYDNISLLALNVNPDGSSESFINWIRSEARS